MWLPRSRFDSSAPPRSPELSKCIFLLGAGLTDDGVGRVGLSGFPLFFLRLAPRCLHRVQRLDGVLLSVCVCVCVSLLLSESTRLG